MKNLKIFICGPGRHGKDTVAEILKEKYGLTFESSSMFCAKHVCRPWLEALGVTYNSLEECYADRVNRRIDWYNAIRDYNKGDEARLSAKIFSHYNVYVGIRSRVEFLTAKKLSNLSIWVDSSSRIKEIDPTIKILPGDCDIILDNNDSVESLREKVTRIFDLICKNSI